MLLQVGETACLNAPPPSSLHMEKQLVMEVVLFKALLRHFPHAGSSTIELYQGKRKRVTPTPM